ncbi:MAG: serine hydrolase [Blastocatellia bacterium]|nr:serine hydrolase [Blastocatellia bacterium]
MMSDRIVRSVVALFLLGAWCVGPWNVSSRASVEAIQPEASAALTAVLEPFIRHEMADKDLPALSIAVVDDQRLIWARGFGYADPERKIPATPGTVYRVGSVSKLFTAIAIMQWVEQGKLSLDAPITGVLPDFRPKNPFGTPITLRQLLSHRAGLVREPPVGHYFDPTEPTLAATVASLNETELIYPPSARTKYSNAGIAVVGAVLERLSGEPFARYVKRAVLQPLGLSKSSFEPEPELIRDLAKGYMWTYHGRVFEAPTFQLGMAPAGSMYSTVVDLARFLSALFAGGRGVLRPQTLAEMWTPQFAGEASGFGIGFAISRLDGHRRIGHGGAIYGFATELAALPDQKLGVVVVATKDFSNRVVERIADAALRILLAVRENRPLPTLVTTSPVPPEMAERLRGRYRRGEEVVDVIRRGREVYAFLRGLRVRIRQAGGQLIVDDRHAFGTTLELSADGLLINGQKYERIPATRPAPVPPRWRGLIGEYGWDHNVLYILEENGQLYALIEWFFFYPLRELRRDVFQFPARGLYDGEKLTFTRDRRGRATAVSLEGIVFKRRAVGPEEGNVFRITPMRPVEELRREALAATPPVARGATREPELVELIRFDPTLKLDIRYATTNNFLSTPVYSEARAFLQRPAAEALVRAHRKLKAEGLGLLIHDAYRPWYVTKIFWEATPPDKRIFVADPAVGSRHNRGCAIDLTLYDQRTGRAVRMPSVYDEMSDRAYPDYPGGTSLERWHRERLREAMEAEGFIVYPAEWWHFDYKDWEAYPILNLPFDQIPRDDPRRRSRTRN